VTDRYIFGHVAVYVEDGDNGGIDNVLPPVFFHVFYHPMPAFFGFDGIPKLFKRFAAHIGVADDIMGLAYKFVFGIARNLAKFLIDVGDDPFRVGFRDDVA